jgi:hypothetical protein
MDELFSVKAFRLRSHRIVKKETELLAPSRAAIHHTA